MSKTQQARHLVEGPSLEHAARTEERKNALLTWGHPANAPSIADAVVIKDLNIFLVCSPSGDIPLRDGHGFGLYLGDCRFINGYELSIGDKPLMVLASNSDANSRATIQLTNSRIEMPGGTVIGEQSLGIKWVRQIQIPQNTLFDAIEIDNYSTSEVEIPVNFAFSGEFDDVFAVRGLLPLRPGKLHDPEWQGNQLRLRYSGADGVERSAVLTFSFSPKRTVNLGINQSFQHALRIGPREKKRITVSIRLDRVETAEARERIAAVRTTSPGIQWMTSKNTRNRFTEPWLDRNLRVQTNSLVMDRLLERSFRDLHMLGSSLENDEYFAAGIPWFCALFGRDSLITAIQMLAFDREIARETLTLLARYQGNDVSSWRDEEPGKILHELRTGEFAHLDEIPQTPYYGSVDSTPLYLILLALYVEWSGDLESFRQFLPHVERALSWIDRYGDRDGDGYVEYASSSRGGLVNQGWKDSGDGIVDENGAIAKPPIALSEVQGYVYRAKRKIAELFRRTGDAARADSLENAAAALAARFNRDFWLEDKGVYALGLQGDKKPLRVVTSNAGQVLWSGIADQEKAERVVKRLMQGDMFSGWGIRTLSNQERAFNPIGYHLGTVWPHDNAILAAGFKRHGFSHEACRIFTALVEASMGFAHYRLPEVFAGYRRGEYEIPVSYPVACHPQAWASGSMPYLIQVMLGFRPNALDRKLEINRPMLPDFMDHLEFHDLQIGDATVDLRFERRGRGVDTDVRRVHGKLGIEIVS